MPNININDIYKNSVASQGLAGVSSPEGNDFTGNVSKEDKKSLNAGVSFDSPLRNINIKNPTYNEKEVKTAADEIESRLKSGQSGLAMKNAMVLAESGMTSQDFSKMKEDGFTPTEMEEEEIVTVADKIRVQLAKGGMDISMMGQVSEAALNELSGSAVEKNQIESAISKAAEISEVSDDTTRYLIKNDLDPTIENVHKANYSISGKYQYNPEDAGATEITDEDFEKLKEQASSIIKKAGLPVNEKTLDGAKWLLKEQLPLTEHTISKYMEIKDEDLKTGKQEVLQSIFDAVSEGKAPEDSYILDGFSARERVLSFEKAVSEITDTKIDNAIKNQDPITVNSLSMQPDIPIDGTSFETESHEAYRAVSTRRSLEEIRLSMTYEVSLSMTMRGINLGLTELSDLVDKLRGEETRLYENLFGDSKSGVSGILSFQEKVSIYEETNVSVNALKTAPVSILGGFNSVSEITLRALSQKNQTEVAANALSKAKLAGESYEALMTSPRKDLGDSIKKAFQNVDDILKDLGFENSESNRRAVRILGYNSLSITKESVTTMGYADALVQKTFKNLTPGVVAEMVKKGENPLNLSLEELNQTISKIKESNPETSSDEKYAEFLYKMDMKDGLTKEERDSFVGIYRLMHQVTETDGAAIGALINQGAEITMKNLMMAVRTGKNKNKDIVIDDASKGSGDYKFDKSSLSITEQIQMAFQTARLEDAKEAVTPSKLMNFSSEDQYMDLSPDQFASALENMEEDPKEDMAYVENLKEEISCAANSETKVYEALRQFDLPVSPANLQAMNAFLSDRNGVFRKIFSQTVTDEDLKKTPKELMADIIEDFGEAIKRPKDMADAQQKLAETAENVMKKMLTETEVGHVNIRGMRVALKQVKMLGKIAERAENYTIPITVADENGTLNLRVVRGENDENGLVDIAFNMDKTGPVNATIKASAQGVTGSISAVKAGILDAIKKMEEPIAEAISSIANLPITFEYNENKNLTEDDIYREKDPGFTTTGDQREVPTEKLYGIAKTFVEMLGKIEI